MNWIIFGDDWGRHISTTQHLASELARQDRVLWVNSMGMRSPRLRPADLLRLSQKAFAAVKPGQRRAGGGLSPSPEVVIHPRVLPWHDQPAIHFANRVLFGRQIGRAIRDLRLVGPTVLLTYPVPVRYLDFDFAKLAYLRLDDYRILPGADPGLVDICEHLVLERAHRIFVTAEKLMPEDSRLRQKCRYLPQGVDVEHFADAPLGPPGSQTIGFYGLLAEWLDYALVEEVAVAMPDWRFEFVGPVRFIPPALARVPNVRLRAAVPYSELPAAISHWAGAWVPFQVNDLTRGVNPLKLREYLAAGLPAFCTDLPEAAPLRPFVHIASDARQMAETIRQVVADDSPERRRSRRERVRGESWRARAEEMRRALQGAE